MKGSTNTQIHKYTNTQIHRYTNTNVLHCVALHGKPGPVSPGPIMQHSHSPHFLNIKTTGVFDHKDLAQNWQLFVHDYLKKKKPHVWPRVVAEHYCTLVAISCWCHSGGHLTWSATHNLIFHISYIDMSISFLFILHIWRILVGGEPRFWMLHLFLSIIHCQCIGLPFPFVVF